MNKKIVTVLSLALATAIVGNANATEDVYNRAAVGNRQLLVVHLVFTVI